MVEIKNYMEEFVFSQLNSLVKNLDVCQCEICKMDMAAMVLNALPSKYVVTREGVIYQKIQLLQLQYEVDVIKELTKAAEIVNSTPRH